MGAFDWMTAELADLRGAGLLRSRRVRALRRTPRVHRGPLLNFGSNDYLNLAGDIRLARAAARAANHYGVGATASPLVCGRHPPLRRLERALADFEREETSLVFSSGFAANLGVVSALVGQGDAVFSDRLNHASLIDGCRLSGARIQVYDHADAGHVEELLRCYGAHARRRLIVTDSVFSMDGDLAPLAELARLACQHDAMLLVDEAHATGVLGPNGRGLAATLEPRGPHCPAVIKMGTLSKALGAQGGFVAGPRRLGDWLANRARPYLFSTAIAPPICAAAARALRIVIEEPERHRHVLGLAERLRDGLVEQGLDVGRSACHIVPVMIGDAAKALRLSHRLRERGFLAPAIRPPSVPPGGARLRLGVTAGHCEADVADLIETLVEEAQRERLPR